MPTDRKDNLKMSTVTSKKTIVVNGIAIHIDNYTRDGRVVLTIGGIGVDVEHHNDRGESCTSVKITDLDGEKIDSFIIE